MLAIPTIAAEILKTLGTAVAHSLSGSVVARLKKSRSLTAKMEDYLSTLSNRVSILVTYRPILQHIDDAHVESIVVDNALCLAHIKAEEYEDIYDRLIVRNMEHHQAAVIAKYLAEASQEASVQYKLRRVPTEELLSGDLTSLCCGRNMTYEFELVKALVRA